MAEASCLVGPALDAGEQAFNPRPVAVHDVARIARRRVQGLPFPSILFLDENRNQILGTRKNEGIGFFCVEIFRQTFIGSTRDGRNGEVPAKAEWAVTGAGVIAQRKLRAKTRAAGRCKDRHGHRSGAGHRIGAEFFPYSADRPAALRKGD